MTAIRLHLEQAERDTIDRYARTLGVTSEDVAYAALNRLMLECNEPRVRRDVVETREWRRENLPLWSDSACSVHAYEGKQDEEPSPSRFR